MLIMLILPHYALGTGVIGLLGLGVLLTVLSVHVDVLGLLGGEVHHPAGHLVQLHHHLLAGGGVGGVA